LLTQIATMVAAGHSSSEVIGCALEFVRKHLGVEVAYVSEFSDGRSVYQHVDAPGLEALIKPGDSRSLDDVYCNHILEGRLPELMPDTSDYPLAVGMPITAAVPIGAHVSVPIRMPDGRAYGMFCCLSPTPNRSLNHRDLEVMRAFADMTALQISKDKDAERRTREAQERITQVIETRAFRMAFQPIFTFEPFQVTGFESLCRFTAEPYRSPDLWFEDAARAGRGVELETVVLRQALEALQVLPDDIFVSINVAPDTVLSGQLPDLLAGHPLRRIVVEVTEHAQVEDYGALRSALEPLRQLGVRLAIDDAGAGYASLQHIIQLQPDIIKLDTGLTRGVDSDPARRALVAALTYFAAETGSSIVAEGIETESEMLALKTIGIAKGQGYLLGRPGDLESARHCLGADRSAQPGPER